MFGSILDTKDLRAVTGYDRPATLHLAHRERVF
jgi:hypothetical protein